MKKIFIFLYIFFSIITIVYTQPSAASAADDVPESQQWIIDNNLTLVAKNTARFGMLFDWSIQNYTWECIIKYANKTCNTNNSPLQKLWTDVITFIVVPLLIIFIFISAVVLIVSRGTNTTLLRLIPKFIISLIFIFLSYAIVQFIYQFVDVMQGVFLRTSTNTCPPECITQANLFGIGWDYQVVGMRLNNPKFGESTLVSTILIGINGFTYFFISVALMLRKIILWFFLISSPIFPLFFLFPSTRVIAKTWTSIFINWLLYAPLLALFLHSTVYIFSQMPLVYTNPDIGDPNKIVFPTSINLFMGAMGTTASINNSVNLVDTFAQYVFGILMLWVVVALPWLLLKYTMNLNDNSVLMKSLVNISMSLKSTYTKSIKSSSVFENFSIKNTPFVKKPAPSPVNVESIDTIK